jgi:hypothetical protein
MVKGRVKLYYVTYDVLLLHLPEQNLCTTTWDLVTLAVGHHSYVTMGGDLNTSLKDADMGSSVEISVQLM